MVCFPYTPGMKSAVAVAGESAYSTNQIVADISGPKTLALMYKCNPFRMKCTNQVK